MSRKIERVRLTSQFNKSAVNAVKSYLTRVDNGYPKDIRTPFWGGTERQILIEQLRDLIDENREELQDEIYSLEMSQMDKIGPLSIQLPLTERFPLILNYWKYGSLNLDDGTMQAANGNYFQELNLDNRPNRLVPLSWNKALEEMENQTNSGAPYFSRRIDVRERDLMNAKSYSNYPAILGWRGQSSGLHTPPKQRTVFMFPQSTNIMEARYSVPFHKYLMSMSPSHSAWYSPSEVDNMVTTLLNSGSTIISSDFSNYDQSVNPDLMTYVFNLMRSAFQSNDSTRIDLNWIEERFKSIALVMGLSDQDSRDCIIVRGNHGVPSGSNLTNDFDSVLHRLAQHYVAVANGYTLNLASQVQGDDGLLTFLSDFDVDRVLKSYEALGLDVNPDKQHISRDSVMYLQRLHLRNYKIEGKCVGIYPLARALNSLLGSERWRNPDEWPPEFWTIRAIMILENTANHPLFEKFVEFTAKGDKYDLGRKFPGGLETMLGGFNSYVNQAGAYPSYNVERAEDLKGIFQFKVVRYLFETQ